MTLKRINRRMDAWIYCVIILIRRSLCFWEKKGQTQCICIYMCICVCVILQLHHTETMLRCGLPSEKEEGRKVSSDFVWLFFGEHAATVQYGCMWYYNYAMYILQCVIILKKKNHSLRFLLQRGGLLLDTKKWGTQETSETLERREQVEKHRCYVCES